MTTIKAVDVTAVALPTRREHKWTGARDPIGRYVLVRVTGDDGRVGWGEAPVLKDWGGDHGRYYGETPWTTNHVVRKYLGPAVQGATVGDFAGLHARMDEVIRGYPYAKAAVEMAVYDLAGRSRGVPVWMLLGGRARAAVPVTHSIGFLPLDEAVAEVTRVVGEGIRTIKLKVGVDAARDVELVRRVREAVGPAIDICVDANQGYPSPGEAIRTIRAMEAHRLRYVEQPVEGIERMAQVARAVDTPVMADESAWTAQDVYEIAAREAADVISIYTTKPGGLYRAMEVAAVARAAGLPCNVNGSVETGVGNLANVHLAAAAPGVTLSCVIPVSTPAEAQRGQLAGIYYTDDLIVAPFRLVDGAVPVPEGPGMGIDVDPAKIARYEMKLDG